MALHILFYKRLLDGGRFLCIWDRLLEERYRDDNICTRYVDHFGI
jgi:hypothetical protein